VDPVILWPLLVYAAAVFVLVAGMLGLSYVLGERHKQKATGEPYESGIPPTGSGRLRFDVKFYLIAMFFVVFDLEAAFLFAWAIAFRDLGWLGYVEAVIFVGILLVALIYLWRVGALDWGPGRRRPRQTNSEE
jgi:NADH-quinone oxidoreductase subunit A